MVASDATKPFPELPLEISCRIMEIMLEMVPKRALELITISRSLQLLVEQALYHCVILKQQRSAEAFRRAIQYPCRSSWVNTLCITSDVKFSDDLSDLHALFSMCPNIQTMAIDSCIPSDNMVSDGNLDALASSGPRPTKLRYNFGWIQRHDGSHLFSLPLFQNVTHLELWDEENFDNLTELDCLPHLTHLSLIIDPWYPLFLHLENLQQKLSLSDSILVCIIFGDVQDLDKPEKIQNACVRFSDPRIVFSFSGYAKDPKQFGNVLWREILNESHLVRQWGAQDDGEMDMWEEAEAIVSSPGKPFGLYRVVDTSGMTVDPSAA
ncbi:hypothetical protein BDP27DRAFT_1332641 [Rhodocollybia butyracea]|uniref:Uncharacterized protein n=1 Tax=Rhodocollybia butyracea TaxID=206335 RepID=A0A9P5PN44_9AGAR|nr:hypothetical protein BDP27DRAFT_1332641 [Rhodocollybia butyracea]